MNLSAGPLALRNMSPLQNFQPAAPASSSTGGSTSLAVISPTGLTYPSSAKVYDVNTITTTNSIFKSSPLSLGGGLQIPSYRPLLQRSVAAITAATQNEPEEVLPYFGNGGPEMSFGAQPKDPVAAGRGRPPPAAAVDHSLGHTLPYRTSFYDSQANRSAAPMTFTQEEFDKLPPPDVRRLTLEIIEEEDTQLQETQEQAGPPDSQKEAGGDFPHTREELRQGVRATKDKLKKQQQRDKLKGLIEDYKFFSTEAGEVHTYLNNDRLYELVWIAEEAFKTATADKLSSRRRIRDLENQLSEEKEQNRVDKNSQVNLAKCLHQAMSQNEFRHLQQTLLTNYLATLKSAAQQQLNAHHNLSQPGGGTQMNGHKLAAAAENLQQIVLLTLPQFTLSKTCALDFANEKSRAAKLRDLTMTVAKQERELEQLRQLIMDKDHKHKVERAADHMDLVLERKSKNRILRFAVEQFERANRLAAELGLEGQKLPKHIKKATKPKRNKRDHREEAAGLKRQHKEEFDELKIPPFEKEQPAPENKHSDIIHSDDTVSDDEDTQELVAGQTSASQESAGNSQPGEMMTAVMVKLGVALVPQKHAKTVRKALKAQKVEQDLCRQDTLDVTKPAAVQNQPPATEPPKSQPDLAVEQINTI